MLRGLTELTKYAVETMDGIKERVDDFFFDDWVWTIRYLVVDTGRWLPGRHVLVSPVSFGRPDWNHKVFPIELTRDQIEHSPPVDSDKPVSRKAEVDLTAYYSWPPYWTEFGISSENVGEAVAQASLQAAEKGRATATAGSNDRHLQSVNTVLGYRVHAKDGAIGHLNDLIVDDELWAIRYAVVDTGKWLPGRKVLLATQWIREVKWLEKEVYVTLTKDQIRQSPPFEGVEAIDRPYEAQLHDFYGRPRYWQ